MRAHWFEDQKIGSFTHTQLHECAEKLNAWSFKPGGTEGYRTAEVTLGGISTNEVSSKTFAVEKVPGLYAIGEAIDVAGWLGGYNFQWAWASAYCCATQLYLTGQRLKRFFLLSFFLSFRCLFAVFPLSVHCFSPVLPLPACPARCVVHAPRPTRKGTFVRKYIVVNAHVTAQHRLCTLGQVVGI
jgi:hypothetical protein